jgi:hypothetical protein
MANGLGRRRLPVVFYADDTGNEPVREWLKDSVRRTARRSARICCGTGAMADRHARVPEPGTGSLGGADEPVEQPYWVLFFVAEHRIGVLHAFFKKTRKTPKDDIELALKCRKEMKEWP